MARPTREHETVVDAVFFGIEQVGADSVLAGCERRLRGICYFLPFATETEMNLINLLVIATDGRRWA